MGLIDDMMGSLMGGKIGDELRKNCPESLMPALEKLLADSDAVKTITGYVGDCMSGQADFSVDKLMALPFGQAIQDLLHSNPDLANHLISTAKSKLGL